MNSKKPKLAPEQAMRFIDKMTSAGTAIPALPKPKRVSTLADRMNSAGTGIRSIDKKLAVKELVKGKKQTIWSFDRIRDETSIKTQEIVWKGPFSLPGFKKESGLESTPNVEGVYIFCFGYQEGFILYFAGISKSVKRRMRQHIIEYREGNYTVLDVESACKGERLEIWPGWQYAKKHRDEFNKKKEVILEATEKQLKFYRIFIAEVSDKRIRARIEAAIMKNIYASKEPWSGLADKGMLLSKRYNSEMPIQVRNIVPNKIFGLPEILEV